MLATRGPESRSYYRGLNNYQYHVEVQLRNPILSLCQAYGTIILGIIQAPVLLVILPERTVDIYDHELALQAAEDLKGQVDKRVHRVEGLGMRLKGSRILGLRLKAYAWGLGLRATSQA